jgi:hypothetical protein
MFPSILQRPAHPQHILLHTSCWYIDSPRKTSQQTDLTIEHRTCDNNNKKEENTCISVVVVVVCVCVCLKETEHVPRSLT